MYTVIKSILSRDTDEVAPLIDQILNSDSIILTEERDYFEFLQQALASGATPSEALFRDQFPDTQVFLDPSPRLSVQDAKTLFTVETKRRQRTNVARQIHKVAERVEAEGWTDEEDSRLRKLRNDLTDKVAVPVSFDLTATAKTDYEYRCKRPPGLYTGVPEIDHAVGGLAEGTLNTLIGFTGHFKSTWALNITYLNALEYGYNIAYMSFEMAREELVCNFLSRHSAASKFDRYPFIAHDRIRRGELDPEEQDYLFNVIAPDFDGRADLGEKKGKIYLLDSSQFRSYQFEDIQAKMEEIDDHCLRTTGSPIDAFVWDHLQIFKFNRDKAFGFTNELGVMNAYVHQFMDWAIEFRGRPTIQLLLAQTNRDGWKRAVRNGGIYDITALAEVNEAERASSRVLSIYVDDSLKASHEVKVQILKSRYGPGLADPVTVPIEPACAFLGGRDVNFDNLSDTELFDSLFND